MNPLKPTPALLAKLGSLIYHLEEAMDSGGHPDDLQAAVTLREDPDIKEWFQGMAELALVPVKRRLR
jgi:hypothetical protein